MKEDPGFREILDNLFEGVYYVDLERRVRFWNRGAERITGYAADEVIGSGCSDNILVHVDDRGNNLCSAGCPLTASLRSGEHHRVDSIYLHHKEGHRVPVSVSISSVRDGQGRIVGAVEVFSETDDALGNKQYLRDLREAAQVDFLTGLPNRRSVETKLGSVTEEMRRHGTRFAVLFIDLDHFKKINDTYGHEVGDRVIKMAAMTLERNTRIYNLVGRWGGEEFVAIVSHIDEVNIRLLADKLCRLVGNSFFEYEGEVIRVTATIGVALARQDDTPQSILKRADEALYQGKRSGRNCAVFEGEIVQLI